MFYTRNELEEIGFKSLGENVLISNKSSIYGANNISIGNNVRIDDFTVLSSSSEMTIGDYVHIACHASLIGKGKIVIGDYVGISINCVILSSSDDFSGEYMNNPTIPSEYLNVKHKDVIIGKHVPIGAGSIILPDVTIGDGAAIGAMSLVKKSIPPFEIWVGNPIRFIKKRSDGLLNFEKKLKNEKQ